MHIDLSFVNTIQWWQWLIVISTIVVVGSALIERYKTWKENREDWED